MMHKCYFAGKSNMLTRMHSSRMCTVQCSGHFSCHRCPNHAIFAMHAPLPCTPPCHTCLPWYTCPLCYVCPSLPCIPPPSCMPPSPHMPPFTMHAPCGQNDRHLRMVKNITCQRRESYPINALRVDSSRRTIEIP